MEKPSDTSLTDPEAVLDPKVKEVLGTVATKVRDRARKRGANLANDLKPIVADFLKDYPGIYYIKPPLSDSGASYGWGEILAAFCDELAKQAGEIDVSSTLQRISDKILELDQNK